MSLVVVGRNKIVRDLEEAMDRIKNVIAPENFRIGGVSTPCVKAGRCLDCSGARRHCAVTTIIERQPMMTDLHVLLIDEDLGLGWDKSWPEERIGRIVKRHVGFMVKPHQPLKKGDKGELWRMARAKRRSIGSGPDREAGEPERTSGA